MTTSLLVEASNLWGIRKRVGESKSSSEHVIIRLGQYFGFTACETVLKALVIATREKKNQRGEGMKAF